ncbi:hypothetical protein RF11_00847 [Thelohanellus kitauei]|uniref:Uncharacterized protein n=1 Tax=Thelohanellus kitauei TaxID=669202 RepID=A0A0C2MSC3_THEKT|nr:hypothetical protein RF11_00847 [Thelohanellus kitauei]
MSPSEFQTFCTENGIITAKFDLPIKLFIFEFKNEPVVLIDKNQFFIFQLTTRLTQVKNRCKDNSNYKRYDHKVMENIEDTNSERRTYKKLSIDVKMLAISYNQRNPEKSIAEVARNLSLNECTLRYTYSKFLRDGNVIQNSQAGPKYIKVEE